MRYAHNIDVEKHKIFFFFFPSIIRKIRNEISLINYKEEFFLIANF